MKNSTEKISILKSRRSYTTNNPEANSIYKFLKGGKNFDFFHLLKSFIWKMRQFFLQIDS